MIACPVEADGVSCYQFEIEHPFIWNHAAAPFCGKHGNLLGVEPLSKRTVSEQGSELINLWAWKLAVPEEDTRPQWQIGFDNGMVKFRFEHGASTAVCVF